MPYADSTVLFQAADTIRHNSIGGPITSADHVAGSSAGDPDGMILKERAAISLNGQLGRSFARAVRIVASQGVLLAIAVRPFPVFVTLIRGDRYRRTGMTQVSERLQDVNSS